MSVVPIPEYPYPPLREKSIPVTTEDLASEEFKHFLRNLVETLQDQGDNGAGLAANQLGLAKRVFVTNMELENGQWLTQIFINPQITEFSKEKDTDWEGCLSFPEQWGKVQRSQVIKIKAHNLAGEEFSINASGFYARLLQHETDHLDGILFIDKLHSEVISTEELHHITHEQHVAAG